MNNSYKKYITKYGYFSHIIQVELDENLSEDEKNIILSKIYDLINEKDIEKKISDINICLKWRAYDETHLLNYYTDCHGIFGDKGIHEHTKLLLNDIKKIINSDKFDISLTKLLTKSICIM